MTKADKERQRLFYETKVKPPYDAWIQHYPFTLDDLDGEEWRPVLGYEEFYCCSSYGRVKSFYHNKARILKPSVSKGGYLYVNLCKNGGKRILTIHRLAAKTFIPNPEQKPEVNHRDGQKLNCCIENLEWVTGSENEKHAVGMGLLPSSENNWQSSLTNEQATWCRKVYIPHDNEWGIAAIARKLGKDKAAIQRVVHGHTYKSCGGKIHEVKAKPPCVPDDIRREIKRRYKKGSADCGAPALAKEFGIGETTIYRIIQEK